MTASGPVRDEQVPPKDSAAESSGLQHGVAAPARPCKKPAWEWQRQRQGAVVVSLCCSLRARAIRAVCASEVKGRRHDCKEERRKKCDIRSSLYGLN
jgi:hypothetical protein